MISYQFTMKVGPTPGKIIQLMKPELSIGREIANDIVISDADVSRRHARLTRKGDTYLLEDLASTNGTYVNGQRLTAPQILQPADQIRLGEAVMLVYDTLAVEGQPNGMESQPELIPVPEAAPIAAGDEMVAPPSPANIPPQPPASASPEAPASLAASLLGGMNRAPRVEPPQANLPAESAPAAVVYESEAPVDAPAGGEYPYTNYPSFQPAAPGPDDNRRIVKIGLIMGGAAVALLCLCAAVGLIAYLIFLE